SIFRIVAIIGLIIFIGWMIKKKNPTTGFVVCMALITSGAIGNLMDCMFYGMFFGPSGYSANQVAEFLPDGGGYAPFLQGKVVDMIFCPMIDTTLPEWVPFKGGEHFVFFSPIFNIADAAVTVGTFAMILFQKRIFPKTAEDENLQAKEKAI
ncbi:MAG: signal peptidase II, partial [Bacteroidales bacterium]|nr:signal peptidase II [Bacteroidales bacterium]